MQHSPRSPGGEGGEGQRQPGGEAGWGRISYGGGGVYHVPAIQGLVGGSDKVRKQYTVMYTI